ncbi:glutamate racemase [uncultured Desulfovibrio sp.]|uniref:glutamate racemase n=1 Tax=uncultured Desulfovibrio sp. TaxID=167968 RepID=UPI002603120E|nr:glutamate racemase [uncultured Desulfovibrio sp.]
MASHLNAATAPSTTSLPIGLFDSGIGGLTVLRAISTRLPQENLLYLGDTARLPYGTKSRETIIRYTLKAAQKLVDCGVKMLVVACNTATSAALTTLREHFAPLPVLGVVEPGARAAVAATRNRHIAVIGTEATIADGAYQKAITRLLPDASVLGRPCTLFVSLAEEGWLTGPVAEGTAHRYLDDLFQPLVTAPRPDTLVLGCTHFPLFADVLQQVVGETVHIVDSAATTAEAVDSELRRLGLARQAEPGVVGERRFMTTDNCNRFVRTASIFLGQPLHHAEVELVNL